MSGSVVSIDEGFMRQALLLAERGRGHVEPNPLVGCVIAHSTNIVGEGWHGKFGGPHAEVVALQQAGDAVRGATMYVTLEPCCHHGKTPPCTDLIIHSGIQKVVLAHMDPFPEVAGNGVDRLRAAGVQIQVGVLEEEARRLNAPYLRLSETGRPWVIAKWAMTLDGKLASRSGCSHWISNDRSRAVVHAIRGRVDGIIVGIGTALADDPQLTARPPGARTATRIILDSQARLPSESQLVRTANQVPVLVAAGPEAPPDAASRLVSAGCEIVVCSGRDYGSRLKELLAELGRRRMTNVLVEGGARVLAAMFDKELIDEVHVFVAPKLIGGETAISPLGGEGWVNMLEAASLQNVSIQQLDNDVYISGPVAYRQSVR